MSTSTLFLIGDIILYAGGPAILLFVIFYGARSQWRTLLAGRSLMYMSVAMLSIITLAIVTAIFGPSWPGRGWVRLLIYLGMTTTLWKMFVTLVKIQRHPERYQQSERDL